MTNHMSYEQWVVALRLPSLLFRRQQGDMIQVYKIMNGIETWAKSILQQSTQWPNQRSFVGHCQLEIRKNSISQQVVQDWNSLLDCVVTASGSGQKPSMSKAPRTKTPKSKALIYIWICYFCRNIWIIFLIMAYKTYTDIWQHF